MNQPPPRIRIPTSDVRAYIARIHGATDVVELDQITREVWRRYQEEGLARIEIALRLRRRVLESSSPDAGGEIHQEETGEIE